jgi:transcriptional regulator with XRE-family HTH domain
MTRETVSEESRLNIKQVGALVRGQGNPTYTTLLKLCRGLHVRPGGLMVLADELRKKRLLGVPGGVPSLVELDSGGPDAEHMRRSVWGSV